MSHWLKLINGWFRPKFEPEENSLDRFERLWKDQQSGRRITFMSIAFNTSTTGEIEDIGLSYWSRWGIQQQIAYHWRVGGVVEPKDVTVFGNPDSFNFGTTQIISASDVRTVLDDWVLSLYGSCEELCIVMYGEQLINTLGRHWKSAVPVVVLDLEAAWHQRHHKTVYSRFEEVASTSEDIANATSTSDHAGNQAYCLLILLKSLKKKTESAPEEPERSID